MTGGVTPNIQINWTDISTGASYTIGERMEYSEKSSSSEEVPIPNITYLGSTSSTQCSSGVRGISVIEDKVGLSCYKGPNMQADIFIFDGTLPMTAPSSYSGDAPLDVFSNTFDSNGVLHTFGHRGGTGYPYIQPVNLSGGVLTQLTVQNAPEVTGFQSVNGLAERDSNIVHMRVNNNDGKSFAYSFDGGSYTYLDTYVAASTYQGKVINKDYSTGRLWIGDYSSTYGNSNLSVLTFDGTYTVLASKIVPYIVVNGYVDDNYYIAASSLNSNVTKYYYNYSSNSIKTLYTIDSGYANSRFASIVKYA